jgi:hypothetical protein
MHVPFGKNALQEVANFEPRRWFVKEMKRFALLVTDTFRERNEVLAGGVTTEGTGSSDTDLVVNVTELHAMLRGRLMDPIAAISDDDLFTTAGNIGQAIFQDGSDASGITLADEDVAKVTLIVANSDGAGGASDDDNDTAILIAVVAGTSGSLGSDHLSSKQIQDALDASTGVHAGTTGWAHVALIDWEHESTGPVTTVTISMNRNNIQEK